MTTYPTRTILNLDGLWSFRFTEGATLSAADPKKPNFDDTMAVPAAFDATPRYRMKRGLAVYGRTFSLPKACRNALLRVGAAGLSARFWIDGREVGFVEMGYNAYEFETGPLAAGEHTVFAATDNNLTWETPFFQPNYDFYGYGGIYRHVDLAVLPGPASIDRVQVRTTDAQAGRVELRFLFRGKVPANLEAIVAFDTDKAPRTVKISVQNGEAVWTAKVPKARRWSPDDPALHTVTVRALGDEIVETFGIRDFSAENGRFWLNGEPIVLRGFNRHETHPECGPATSEAIMLEDLHHLKELGCNFIRGSHYPQDPRFLDLCDRLGVLVWEEGLAWGENANRLANPVFCDGQVAQMRRMVRKSVNHPSVVVWAFLNEFDSGCDAGVALCRRLVDALHEEDWSRPVSFACNRGRSDRCAGLVDFPSFNTYPGWICPDSLDQPEDPIAANVADFVDFLASVRRPGAPIFVSEMGTCGIYGAHDEAAAQWTEEFQVRYMVECIRQAFSHPEVQGMTIWQFTDCMSFHRFGGGLRTKPLAQNLAGVYDVYRRPKLAAAAVADAFRTVR